jgi:hypothetical protein
MTSSNVEPFLLDLNWFFLKRKQGPLPMEISAIAFVNSEIATTEQQRRIDEEHAELQSCQLMLVGGGIGDVVAV